MTSSRCQSSSRMQILTSIMLILALCVIKTKGSHIKRWRVGEQVEVYSHSSSKWIDGVVTNVLADKVTVDYNKVGTAYSKDCYYRFGWKDLRPLEGRRPTKSHRKVGKLTWEQKNEKLIKMCGLAPIYKPEDFKVLEREQPYAEFLTPYIDPKNKASSEKFRFGYLDPHNPIGRIEESRLVCYMRSMLYVPTGDETYQSFYLSTGTSNPGKDYKTTFFPNKCNHFGGPKCEMGPRWIRKECSDERTPWWKALQNHCEFASIRIYRGSDDEMLGGNFIPKMHSFFQKFGTWSQVQVSACLGGFWDVDQKVLEHLGVTSNELGKIKQFVQTHDYVPDKKRFSTRKEPLHDVSQAVKTALRMLGSGISERDTMMRRNAEDFKIGQRLEVYSISLSQWFYGVVEKFSYIHKAEAQWNDGKWYPVILIADTGNDTYTIGWIDSKTTSSKFPADKLRHKEKRRAVKVSYEHDGDISEKTVSIHSNVLRLS